MEFRLDLYRLTPDRGIVALLALLLLAGGCAALHPDRAFSPLYHDCWLYHGYFLDLPGHLRAFGDHYYSSRLSITLPGWLAYQALPPLVANHVLHLGVFLLACGSFYVAVRQTVNARTGLLLGLLLGGHYFFQFAATSDYFDGYAIAYFLLSVALLSLGKQSNAALVGAGAALAALVVANLMMALLVVPCVVTFLLVVPRDRWLKGVGLVVFGGLVVLGSLAAFSKLVGGPFYFLSSSLRFAHAFQQQANPFKRPVGEWLPLAGWLLIPLVAAAGGIVFLARRHLGRSRLATWYQVQLLVTLALLTVLEATDRHNLLQVWFYASAFLIPLAFLALAGQWGEWLASLSQRDFLILTVAAVALPIAAAAAPPLTPPVHLLTAAALIAVLLPTPRAGLATGLLALALLTACDLGLRHGFRMHQTLPHSVAHGLRLDRDADYAGRRAEVFLAMHQTMREIRRLDPTYHANFWFDIDEEHGVLFDNVACLHCWGKRLINTAFPDVQPQWTPLRAGSRLLVLSADAGVLPRLTHAVRPLGLGVKPLHDQAAGAGAIRYRVHLVAVTEGKE